MLMEAMIAMFDAKLAPRKMWVALAIYEAVKSAVGICGPTGRHIIKTARYHLIGPNNPLIRFTSNSGHRREGSPQLFKSEPLS